MVGAEQRWSTRPALRTVVVSVHTVATLTRLQDVIGLVESDPRVQLVYTQVPDQLGNGVDWWLRRLGARVMPWSEIPKESFDLALAASLHELSAVQARRLVLPHGAGFIKVWQDSVLPGLVTRNQVYGLDDFSLLDEHGEVVPTSLVLPHSINLETLRRQCPKAVPVAVVAGDPCYDSMVASLHRREQFRRELAVRPGQKLVVLASTWGRQSLFGARLDLYTSLMSTLPADHRVIGVVHPAVWAEHGPRQVLAWLSEARARGVDVVAPGGDWRPLVIAADWVIGDHSSVSVYGAAIGVPFTLAQYPRDEIDSGSVMADLAEVSPRLSSGAPAGQLAAAREAVPRQQKVAAEGVSSEPGRAAEILRREMYRLMDLEEPAYPARLSVDTRTRLAEDTDVYW